MQPQTDPETIQKIEDFLSLIRKEVFFKYRF